MLSICRCSLVYYSCRARFRDILLEMWTNWDGDAVTWFKGVVDCAEATAPLIIRAFVPDWLKIGCPLKRAPVESCLFWFSMCFLIKFEMFSHTFKDSWVVFSLICSFPVDFLSASGKGLVCSLAFWFYTPFCQFLSHLRCFDFSLQFFPRFLLNSLPHFSAYWFPKSSVVVRSVRW